jgi:hypothetical protein
MSDRCLSPDCRHPRGTVCTYALCHGRGYGQHLYAASAIEARSGETAQQARSGTDESAVSEAETPGNTPPEPLHKEDIR